MVNSKIQAAEENLIHVYNRFPIALDHGEGMYLYDTEGKKYLDFAAGYAIPICGYIGARIRPAASVRRGGADPSARRFPPASNACVGRRYHPPPSALQRFT